MTSVTAFGPSYSPFFSLPVLSETTEIENFNQKWQNSYSEVLTQRTQYLKAKRIFRVKAYFSTLNIKQNTQDLSIHNIFMLVMLDLMHSYCHPNSNVIYLASALYAKLQVIPSRTNTDGYFELTKNKKHQEYCNKISPARSFHQTFLQLFFFYIFLLQSFQSFWKSFQSLNCRYSKNIINTLNT